MRSYISKNVKHLVSQLLPQVLKKKNPVYPGPPPKKALLYNVELWFLDTALPHLSLSIPV
jgi:hypothetical protein